MRSTRTAFLATAAFAALAALPSPRALGALAASTFDTGADGWTVTGDPGSALSFTSTDGNPPGAVVFNEAAGGVTDYFVAPAKFLGDLSANAGGTLRFDLKLAGAAAPDTTDGDVILSGPGGTLFAFLPTVPAPGSFTTESLPLDTSTPFTFSTATGSPATAAQIQSVLANVTSLRIRADYINGTDTTTLDNVFLAPAGTAVPTPAAFPAALLTLAAIGAVPLSKRLRRA